MKLLLKTGVVLALLLLVAIPLAAEDKQKKRKKKRAPRENPAITKLVKQVQQADLTDEQAKKIKGLAAEHSAQIRKVQAKIAQILGPEARKAQAAARKKAAAEGKKGKQLQEAVAAAVSLSDEQQEKLAGLRKQSRQLQVDFRQAVASVLTPEQREKAGLKQPRKTKEGAKKKRKRKKGADA